jgi:hypothetical protein
LRRWHYSGQGLEHGRSLGVGTFIHYPQLSI